MTVRIGSGAEVWIKIYDLHPNETRAVSIGEVVANALPDEKGHVLSGAKNTGEVGWWAPSDGYSEVSGRVVQQDSGGTLARNFSCGGYISLCNIGFPAGSVPIYLEFDNDGVLDGQPVYCSSNGYGGSGCTNTGQPATEQVQMSWSWSSNNTNIMQAVSGASSSSATWQGMGVGNTTFAVRAWPTFMAGNSCSGGGGGSVQACGTPTGETSASARQNLTTPYAPTATDFLQTLVLAPPLSAGGECGAAIDEAENAIGTDSCYFTGSSIPRQTAVTGGHWLVGQITPNFAESQVVLSGPGQWGPDIVGWNPGGVKYYQANRPKAGLQTLCTATYYQNVAVTCPQQAPITFGANILLTSTIDATGLTNCREGACSGHVPYQ